MLTDVASNNGINISTGSREPSQQKGPRDPLEHLKKKIFPETTQSVPLEGRTYGFFLN